MITLLSFLNGISAFILILNAWFLVFVNLYFYIKDKKQVHINMAILNIAIGLGWMGITITFFSTLIFGENLPWVEYVISYFSYSTIPIGAFTIAYVTYNLAGSQRYRMLFYIGALILSIAYYVILYFTFSISIEVSQAVPGEILDDWARFDWIFYYFIWITCAYSAFLTAIGFGKLGKLTSGIVKKRSIILLLATFIVGGSILLDTVILGSIPLGIDHNLFLSIPRFLMIVGIYFILIGLWPSTE